MTGRGNGEKEALLCMEEYLHLHGLHPSMQTDEDVPPVPPPLVYGRELLTGSGRISPSRL